MLKIRTDFLQHRTIMVITLVVIIMVLGFICIKGQNTFDQAFSENKDKSIKELVHDGYTCITANKKDSALFYYTMAIGKYSDQLGKEDKERCAGAYCNAGYIYFFDFNDHTKAYRYLLKALSIAEEIESKQLIPYIYLNMADIYVNYGDRERTISLYNKSFKTSYEIKEWSTLLSSFSNLIFYSELSGRRDSTKYALESFGHLNIPDTIPMKDFCVDLKKAVLMRHSGQQEKAISLLQGSMSKINDPMTSERVQMQTISLISKLYEDLGKTKDCLATLKSLRNMSQKYHTQDFELEADENLWNLFQNIGRNDSAMYYHTQYLMIADSLFNDQKFETLVNMQSNYEIDHIEEEMKEVARESKTKTIILVIISAFMVLIVIMAIIIVLKNRRLEENNKMLYLQIQKSLKTDEKEREHREKYQNSLLKEDDKEKLMDKIRDVMEDVTVISDTNFSIVKLAELVGSKDRYVSQVINEKFGTNFSAFLAEYRIKEACRRLRDSEHYGQFSLEGISLSLGFKSRTNFSAVFKKITGITPSKYQELSKADN